MSASTCFAGLSGSSDGVSVRARRRARHANRAARRISRAVAAGLEPLERRQLLSTNITINGSITLDESPGLQNTNVPVTGEDNNDSDVSLATLQSGAAAFSNRLFNSVGTGGLGLSTSFATSNGVAQSASNFITVSGGTVTSLGFVKDDGTALPAYAGVATGGVATTLSAVSGGTISLFADASLGNRMVLGVDANNDIVFSIFMDPNASLTTARAWTVQFEAVSNPVATNPDDPVDLTGFLDVAASTSLAFNFNNLPSGQNLFGTVGDTSDALTVIGKNPVLNPDGTFTNASNTINTSQGGGNVTIGVNNQMFDPGDGAYFTYVKSPVANFLAGAPGGLDQNEADDADNIQYTGGTLASTGASTTISQTQGNAAATMKITAYDIAGSPQGQAFVSGLASGTPVTITSVKVNGVAVSFTVSGNGVVVSNLHAGDTIAWTTSAPHDRVLIEDVAGKFDIGAFAINQADAAHVDVGSQLRFEDAGPSIGPIANSIVDFIAGASATKSLNGVVGTDPNGAPYTIDQFTASITVNGVLVKGVASGNNTVVTYYADTNNDTIFGNTGDTAYYKLELNQTANSGAGSYTFTVLVTPPPPLLEFDFDDLPSGQNLFGTVGDTSNALVVIGKTPVLNPDGTFTNASNTINTSQGGGGVTIGVNNQMFDPGDGAYFTYVKSPVANFLSGAPGGLDQGEADDADNIQYTGGTLAATTASTTISQTQGNAAASMKITAYDIAGSPQGQAFATGLGSGTPVTITGVKVNGVAVSFTPSGNGVIVSGLHSGDVIEWTTSAPHDRVLIEGVAGKFDIGAFAVTQAQPTPDQKLDFVVKVTDGDGDSATSGFSIGIDGTGPFDDGAVGGVAISSLSSIFSSNPIDDDALAALLA
jgi:hypothetical protein